MTEEITYYDEELTELIRNIEDAIDGLPKKRQNAKAEVIHEAEERMKRAKQVLHSFKVEMRELPRDQLQAFEQKHKEHHDRLQALNGDIQIVKGEVDRQNLGVRSIDEMTAHEILDVASKTQDQSLASVNRMKQRIEESKQVGTATAEQLRSQTEQLKNIDVDIMKVKSNLNRADVLIRAFVRKMMTDKIILVLVCLIFLGVIGIIVYRVIDPNAGSDSSTTVDTGWNSQVYSANQNSRLLAVSQNTLPQSQRRERHSMAALMASIGRIIDDLHQDA